MIRVDGVRLRDLSLGGWLGLGLVVVGIYLAATGAFNVLVDAMWGPISGESTGRVVIGVLVAVLGVGMAYENGSPEVEEPCENCAEDVRVRSSREGIDEAVLVQASTSPRRLDVGPFSIVASRRRQERVYCSGECADRDTRMFLDVAPDAEDLATPQEVATDGGE